MQDFQDIPYETWLEQLQKELKTGDLSEKHVQIDHDLPTNPFFERVSKEANGKRHTSSWTIADELSLKNHDQADILEALNGGINGLILDHAEELSDSAVFDGVFFKFIKTYIHFSVRPTETQFDKVLSILEEKGRQHFHISTSVLSSEQIKTANEAGFSLLWFYSLDGDHIVDQLASITNAIIEYLDNLSNNTERQKAAEKIVIKRHLSTDIIREIAIKQAIEMIWKQIMSGFSLDEIAVRTHALCDNVDDETLERQYIALASKGLTAVTASYDLVQIKPASTEKSKFHHRISRNIQHLLTMESLMENYRHAYLGSYQITQISKEIAEAAWKKVGQV